MTSDQSVSNNNLFKSRLNAKSFSKTVAVVWVAEMLDQCLLQEWCERANLWCDANLALGENSTEPSSSAISFNDESIKETLNVNKVCQR